MLYLLGYRSARYALLALGLLGFFTSVHLACTFSDPPPSTTTPPKKTNPITDSGPLEADAMSGSSSSGGGASSSGGYYGYGYGYGADGCYGYGYGYTSTYDGASSGCE